MHGAKEDSTGGCINIAALLRVSCGRICNSVDLSRPRRFLSKYSECTMPTHGFPALYEHVYALLFNFLPYFAVLAQIWCTIIIVWGLVGAVLVIVKYGTHRCAVFQTQKGQSVALSIEKKTEKKGNGLVISPNCFEPSVAIIRPLKGIDHNLWGNLASSFFQEYPAEKTAVYFTVAEDDDPAIPVAKSVMKFFRKSGRKSHLVVGETWDEANPKVRNMLQAYRRISSDIIWICDSNIYSEPKTLSAAVAKLAPIETGEGKKEKRVGLVHHLAVGVDPRTVGALLDFVSLNVSVAKPYLGLNFTGIISCVIGKSTLFWKSDLDGLGGLSAFGNTIAEDNYMAGAINKELGLAHAMTPYCAIQTLGHVSFFDYIARQARWSRIRRLYVPATTVLELLSNLLVVGVLLAVILKYKFALTVFTAKSIFVAHTLFWMFLDSMVALALVNGVETRPSFLLICFGWLLREIVHIPLQIYALCGNTVTWRNVRYEIVSDGSVRRLGSKM